MKIEDIAEFLNCPFTGDPEYEVKSISEPGDCKEGDLVFFFKEEELEEASTAIKEIAVVIPDSVKSCPARSCIKTGDPKSTLVRLLRHFYPESNKIKKGISDNSCIGKVEMGNDVNIGDYTFIGDGTKIGDKVEIFAFNYIGNEVQIGDGCRIFPHCIILDGTVIGNNVVLYPGVVLGTDGFGFHEMDGKLEHIPQVGNVIIEDDVEIGALSMVDRATIGSTIIGRGTKVDNSVHIAHNVKIGSNAVIVAQVGIAGSCSVGDNAVIAGQVGIADHVKIGKDSTVAAKSGVMRDVGDGEVVFGYPADNRMRVMRNEAYFRKLPELFKRVKSLEESR